MNFLRPQITSASRMENLNYRYKIPSGTYYVTYLCTLGLKESFVDFRYHTK